MGFNYCLKQWTTKWLQQRRREEEKWPEMCNGNTGFQTEYKTKLSTFHHFEMLLLKSWNFRTIQWILFTLLRIALHLRLSATRSLWAGKTELNFTKRLRFMCISRYDELDFANMRIFIRNEKCEANWKSYTEKSREVMCFQRQKCELAANELMHDVFTIRVLHH